MEAKTPIQLACDAVGGQAKLAGLIKVTPQAVSHWVAAGKVPAIRVLEIERVSGVARSDLRPDLYPTHASAAA